MISSEMKKLAEERATRMVVAMDLKEPDRVPFAGLSGDIIATYAGITSFEYEFDFVKHREAIIKWHSEFGSDGASLGNIALGLDMQAMTIAFLNHPEIAANLTHVNGPMNDILKMNFAHFPGRGLDEHSSPQFIGKCNMKPEDYDELIADPIKYCFDYIVPVTSDGLQDLGSPEALATMARFGMDKARQNAELDKTREALMEFGYSFGPSDFTMAPLDFISDLLRGIPNAVLDIRRYPDKVKAATEALVEPMVRMGTLNKEAGSKVVFIPIHLNEYLSPKLYNEFFWPTLKEVILKLIDEGMKPLVFFEGKHEHHLETILDLPKGWGTIWLEKTDVRKAKKLLQGHTCIQGGLETSLVISGNPVEIDQHIKELLTDMMPGGGFILAQNVINIPRSTPMENVRAVYDAVEKYGKY